MQIAERHLGSLLWQQYVIDYCLHLPMQLRAIFSTVVPKHCSSADFHQCSSSAIHWYFSGCPVRFAAGIQMQPRFLTLPSPTSAGFGAAEHLQKSIVC
jgi:hypothetical protein